jgi:hypothetical protein
MSLLTNLISAYTFEASGSMGTDASGNGNTLSLTGSVPQVAGNALPGTNAASWSDSGGVSPAGVLHGNFNYVTAATDFSGIVWVFPLTGTWNTTPYDMFVLGSMNAGTDQYGLFLKQSTKEFYFQVSAGGAGGPTVADGQGAVSFSTWYMVYFQWDFTSKKIGISRNNSTLVEVASGIGGNLFAGPTDWSIGSDGHGAGFTMDGRTDAIALWNRKLSAGEITTLYNGGLGLEYPFPSGRRRAAVIFG